MRDESDREQSEKATPREQPEMENSASPATQASQRHEATMETCGEASSNRWFLINGCLRHPRCPVPVGIKGVQMNQQQAEKFLKNPDLLRCSSVLCQCGQDNLLFNFALDDTKCSKCCSHMAKPGGNKIKLTEKAIAEMPCACGAKVEWLTVHQIQSKLRRRRAGKKISVNWEDIALPKYFHQPKNDYGEMLVPYCTSPDCHALCGGQKIAQEIKILMAQLNCERVTAVYLIRTYGNAVDACLAVEAALPKGTETRGAPFFLWAAGVCTPWEADSLRHVLL